MEIRQLYGWDVDYAEAVRIQMALRKKIILQDEDGPPVVVAGADISYARGDDLFFGAVVLLRLPGLELIESAGASGRVKFPYIPGLLTFREGPILLKAFKKLQNAPDMIIFDGQGIAHPRGLGLASHMGLYLNTPSIGCAKTRLFGIHGEVGPEVGNFSYLKSDEMTIGAALRTKKNVKPVFVSQGHRIGITKAIDTILSCCRGYRVPEPIRRAHLLVNQMRLEAGKQEEVSNQFLLK